MPGGQAEGGQGKKETRGLFILPIAGCQGGLASLLAEETAATAKSLLQRADGSPTFTQHQSWAGPGPASCA